MYKILFIIFLLFFSTSYASNTVATQLEAKLKTLQTYDATFTQITVDDHNTVLQKGKGAVSIKRPHYFRWEVYQPNHQIMILKGSTLWIKDVDLDQVSTQTLSSHALALSPASLLSGTGPALSTAFTISKSPTGAYILTPKEERNSITKIQIYFLRDKLVELDLWNTLGQKNIYQFHERA